MITLLITPCDAYLIFGVSDYEITISCFRLTRILALRCMNQTK